MSLQSCPLISAGKDLAHVCLEENCAWYLKSFKSCSVYVIGYQAALEVKKQQDGK